MYSLKLRAVRGLDQKQYLLETCPMMLDKMMCMYHLLNYLNTCPICRKQYLLETCPICICLLVHMFNLFFFIPALNSLKRQGILLKFGWLWLMMDALKDLVMLNSPLKMQLRKYNFFVLFFIVVN